MLTLTLQGGGTLEVSNPELEQDLLRARAAARGQQEATEKALSVLYRLSGTPNPKRPYNGLLTERLDCSEKTARTLVTEGKIGYVLIGEKKGYRITERQVREFLGDTLPTPTA